MSSETGKKTAIYDRREFLLADGLNAIQAYVIETQHEDEHQPWIEVGFELQESGQGHFCATGHDFRGDKSEAKLWAVVHQAEMIHQVLGEFLAAAREYMTPDQAARARGEA